ncbi:MAG: DUF1559 domain-containing protein [Isosphaerales bacterium]
MPFVAIIGLMGGIGTTGAWGQDGPKPAGPAPLARYFPRQDLVVYAEFDGLDAHRDAWTKTAAYRLLTETTTGAMYEQSISRILDLLLANQSDVPVNGRELTALAMHLLRSGFAVGINRAGGAGPPRCFALVIRAAAKGEARAILDRILRAGAPPRARVEQADRPDGRKLQVLSGPPAGNLAWWAEGDDLVVSLVSPSGPDAIIAAVEGREPNAVEHPNRVALVRSDLAPGFVPVGLAFFDMAALPSLPRDAVGLGLDGIKRFEYRWGFHDQALESMVGVVVPSPRRGIPALFDQPVFDARDLPPLPGALAGFTVLSLDPARFWNVSSTIMKAQAAGPGRAEPFGPDQIEQTVLQATGLRLREDILVHLGPRMTFYNVGTKINAPSHILEGLAQGFFRVPKMAILIEVKDREAIAKALATLVESANQTLLTPPGRSIRISVGKIQRLKSQDAGYVFSLNGPDLPLTAGMRPTLLLGRKTLVIATSPAMAIQARDLSERVLPGGLPAGDPLAHGLESLPSGLTLLSVDDTRQSLLPELVVGLPGLVESLMKGQLFRGVPFLRSTPFQVEEAEGEVFPGGRKVPTRAAAIDPELIPDPDALRPFLFPSIHALVVYDQGIRFVSREAIPTINPATAVPVAIAIMVPAVRSAQIAARRAQSVNNLKQIGLALHNFHSANNHFPADIRGKDGKPLLSWRVQLLPFLEQGQLFNEIHLDEPWDSGHNKALLERMPAAFVVAGTPGEPGMTFYRGFSGKGTIFDPKVPKGIGLQNITDGTSNTIAVVEAKDAVPWTKPDSDLPFDDDPKLERTRALRKELGGHLGGGFNALFCDGSVRFIRETVNPQVLRALLTRNGGEVISSDSF